VFERGRRSFGPAHAGSGSAGSSGRFVRHGEPTLTGREGGDADLAPYRYDRPPTGYSAAGCWPAWAASTSPAEAVPKARAGACQRWEEICLTRHRRFRDAPASRVRGSLLALECQLTCQLPRAQVIKGILFVRHFCRFFVFFLTVLTVLDKALTAGLSCETISSLVKKEVKSRESITDRAAAWRGDCCRSRRGN
jgi:hypothetical protein